MSSRSIAAAALVVVPLAALIVILLMTRANIDDAHRKHPQITNTTAIRVEAPSYPTETRTSRLDLIDIVIPPAGQRSYAADTITVDHVSLKKIVYANPDEAGSERPAYRLAAELLFGQTNQLSLTEVYQRLFSACVTGETLSAYHDALIALRFKALVPIARDALATWQPGDSINVAYTSREILHRLQHPDSLRAMIWLDNALPDNSPLRQGEQPVWWGVLPLEIFYRDDCLDVMVDVVNHPEDHKQSMWLSCLYNIQHFTTDVAMAKYKKGFETMKEWNKYWPGQDPGCGDARAKYKIATQEARRAGTEPVVHRRPKPLLDE